MKRVYLGILWVVFTCFRAQGQASLGFVNVGPPQPNVHLNDTLKFGATLYNYGNATFSDSLVFGLLHNGVNIANPAIFPRPYTGPPVVHMNPGDSIRLNIAIVVTSTDFIVGPTGVVIWPISLNQNILVHDSVSQQFTVSPAAGIDELNAYANMFQSVLTGGLLHLTTALDPALVKEVALYTVNGQLLFTSQEALPINIPVANYATGVFLLQFRLSSGELVGRKVFIGAK